MVYHSIAYVCSYYISIVLCLNCRRPRAELGAEGAAKVLFWIKCDSFDVRSGSLISFHLRELSFCSPPSHPQGEGWGRGGSQSQVGAPMTQKRQ